MGRREAHQLLRELAWGNEPKEHDAMIVEWAISEIESGAESESLLRIAGYSACFAITPPEGQLNNLLHFAMDELGYLWRDYRSDYRECASYHCDKVAAGLESFGVACKELLDEAARLRGYWLESRPYYPIFLGLTGHVQTGEVSEVSACQLLRALFDVICGTLPYSGPSPRPHDDIDLIRLLDERGLSDLLVYCD